MMLPIRRPTLGLLLCLLSVSACTSRDPSAAAGLPPGDIGVPFRNRWWHFYERGLSWGEAGDDRAAEADLRQCLALRQSDSRRARTYGLHFVQCFANRELASVLLRGDRLDEAEVLLQRSLAQEPSAKAEVLLQQLRARRAGAKLPAPASAAAPRLELTSVQPVAGGFSVHGRLFAAAETVLWLREAAGTTSRINADGRGAFQVTAASGAALVLGDTTGPQPGPLLPAAAPTPAPELELDGPGDGHVVTDSQVWYRWSATAAAGLSELTVEDGDGTKLASVPLDGVRSAGTLRLQLAGGPRRLIFTVHDRSRTVGVSERQVESRLAPHQDRSLRAVALALPLQAPRRGAVRPGDDGGLLAALLADGRFRLLDRRADDLLTRELALVEAGLVDRSTAAAAGRRLASRYVIAGTANHGTRDAECYLRLIHSDSGAVVVTADAYVGLGGEAATEALFAAAAGRLRQVFPVIAGPVTSNGSEVRLAVGGRSAVTAHLRLHIFPIEPATGAVAMGEAEITEVTADTALARRLAGSLPASGWAVGE